MLRPFGRRAIHEFHNALEMFARFVLVSRVAHVRRDFMKPISPNLADYWRDMVCVVIGVKPRRQRHLVKTVQTERRFGLNFGLAQRGQQHAGQNGDDRDDHQ